MVPFVDDLNVENLHVQAPTEVIFLCGGQCTDLSPTTPSSSMRDAFRKISVHPAIGSREVMLAEEITQLSTFSAYYGDILEFETDFAQITDLILLFCESVGSFTELGSFASTSEIASRLLVVIREYYWKEDSFIKLGPLAFLKRVHKDSVFVIRDGVIGMTGNDPSTIDLGKLRATLDEPLRNRLGATKERSTFNSERAGHVIKLIVGVVQEYGALEFEEIEFILRKFGVLVDNNRINAYIMCAVRIGWVNKEANGFREFIVAKVENPAIHFVVAAPPHTKDRTRRRLLIREHWEKNDKNRFSVITSDLGL